ncbi:MAG: hypothetical protein HY711_04000, partial [Candidatus Melainabacteria bacterium]|nr:hypothetical protein [Candidatus Melainabacteria bacterium]
MDKEEKVVVAEVGAEGVRKGRRSSSRESNRRAAEEARPRIESDWEEKII